MEFSGDLPVKKPAADGGELDTDEEAFADNDAAPGPAEDASDVAQAEGAPAAEEAQRQLEEQRDKYLRLAAEYDNYRKRAARERAEAGSRAQAELVRQLIDGLDDLARFAHLDPTATDTTTVVQGVELVEKKLLKALTSAGLEVINPVDQPFDPALHEAVGTEPALSPEDDHMVARVYQQGYRFNGQLLRPARVVVKQWER